MKRRTLRLATSLWLILLVALVSRSAFLQYELIAVPHNALRTVPFLYEPGNIAYSLATGHGFSSPFRQSTGPTAWEAPVYPALVAAIFRIFGPYTLNAYLAAASLNIVFSALACVPIFYSGVMIAGTGVGAAAAWLWAIFPNAIIIPSEWVWDTCLSALLAATILWATLKLSESGRLRNWCAYGLLWGFTLLTNPTLASLLPFLLLWLIWRAHRAGNRWRTESALAVTIVVLCCVPWTVRNYVTFHELVPIRSTLGLQLWEGNNEGYRDRFSVWLHPIDNSAERAKYVKMGEIAYMRQKKQEAIQFFLSHPRREAQMCWHRFIGIWTGTATPIEDFVRNDAGIRLILIANFLTAVCALLGIVMLFRDGNPYAFPIAIIPITFPIPFYVSLALLRYRHPIDPIVLLLAAIGVKELAALASRQRVEKRSAESPVRA